MIDSSMRLTKTVVARHLGAVLLLHFHELTERLNMLCKVSGRSVVFLRRLVSVQLQCISTRT